MFSDQLLIGSDISLTDWTCNMMTWGIKVKSVILKLVKKNNMNNPFMVHLLDLSWWWILNIFYVLHFVTNLTKRDDLLWTICPLHYNFMQFFCCVAASYHSCCEL